MEKTIHILIPYENKTPEENISNTSESRWWKCRLLRSYVMCLPVSLYQLTHLYTLFTQDIVWNYLGFIKHSKILGTNLDWTNFSLVAQKEIKPGEETVANPILFGTRWLTLCACPPFWLVLANNSSGLACSDIINEKKVDIALIQNNLCAWRISRKIWKVKYFTSTFPFLFSFLFPIGQPISTSDCVVKYCWWDWMRSSLCQMMTWWWQRRDKMGQQRCPYSIMSCPLQWAQYLLYMRVGVMQAAWVARIIWS